VQWTSLLLRQSRVRLLRSYLARSSSKNGYSYRLSCTIGASIDSIHSISEIALANSTSRSVLYCNNLLSNRHYSHLQSRCSRFSSVIHKVIFQLYPLVPLSRTSQSTLNITLAEHLHHYIHNVTRSRCSSRVLHSMMNCRKKTYAIKNGWMGWITRKTRDGNNCWWYGVDSGGVWMLVTWRVCG